jgi:hypothetical protein
LKKTNGSIGVVDIFGDSRFQDRRRASAINGHGFLSVSDINPVRRQRARSEQRKTRSGS